MKIVQKRVFLQYPKIGEPGMYGFTTTESSAEKFVEVNWPAGAEPNPVDIKHAHDFRSVDDATKYRGKAPFHIREVTITYEFEV